MNLFEVDKEVKLQKTVRVLVYPNITFQADLEKDSYIQVIKKQISLLNEIRDDLWFYLILPCEMESLNFSNVTQYIIKMPTYPPTMRSHFDVPKITKLLGRKLDFDLVMTHLPEHTHALKNVLYNVTHHEPKFFGYCHWWDVKDVVAWSKPSFLQQITGVLEYERCYLNTQHQKDLVLNQASETFNDDTLVKLDHILVPQHLGVDKKDIIDKVNPNPEKIIVFNHRPDTYKHFKQFIEVTDMLWKTRQDFKVWVPLLDKPNRDYVVTDKGNKKWYYKQLQKCCVGFSPKQVYGGWSVATTDGMMNGVPYIMYDDTYYHELYANGDFFTKQEEACKSLNTYLDNKEFRNEEAQKSLNWMSNHLIYEDKMIEMTEYMDKLVMETRAVKDTDKFKEIVSWIKSAGRLSKEEVIDRLGWGRGIKWTPYRRALMNHPNIFDVNDKEPRYFWREE
jgi:glycosyltransferase involved in cell wall biosynthesis